MELSQKVKIVGMLTCALEFKLLICICYIKVNTFSYYFKQNVLVTFF